MATVISIENICKSYRLGVIGSGTLRDDLQGWWHRVRGLPDPNLRVDQMHQAIEGQTLWALQDVSLEVKQGEILGIIGRNGAGKSTLLKILSRVTAPTSGRIRVKGRVASLLEVGTGFHPELTGRENIFLNGAILGMTKAEVVRKFDEIVAFSEIEQFIDTPVKRYSSGMYVRLAFAVAAHLDPEILVVDEVLAVGDAAFQKKCLGKMGAVAGEGRTVLFVSHNMVAVQSLCSRVLLLEHGMVVRVGAVDTIIHDYLEGGVTGGATARVDLSDFKGRTSATECAIKEAWIEDGTGKMCAQIGMGESLSICYRFDVSRSLMTPGFGFGVDDLMGRRLFSANNYFMADGPVETTCQKGIVRCTCPSVPLLPGDYRVNVSLVENHAKIIDYIERTLSLTIIPSDVFGSGRIPEAGHGIFYVPAKISFQENGLCRN